MRSVARLTAAVQLQRADPSVCRERIARLGLLVSQRLGGSSDRRPAQRWAASSRGQLLTLQADTWPPDTLACMRDAPLAARDGGGAGCLSASGGGVLKHALKARQAAVSRLPRGDRRQP